ncbi:hypothetical protein GW793_00540 [bacterium]|uniref:Uncharacterized protein n=2 Tax=Katanobacteria TaxID=422282 RepID=A0A2M7X1A8_UNCKA|nr:hypothetical protein [bacterium]PIP56722.1 MAG: hypothetical protein COX05_01585 [candidate division WWE3 bacterium CG22_combo_CG10-13_8_21_14_all_39_12]PJA39932.1 MAG: hypothetical protein CO179_03955 [candidate division WWE3 bacterium CG_4_9_14_3_um_filter_39_7]
MKPSEFLDKFIDGYLLCDLKQMAKCQPDEADTAGGAGYPMVMTVLSGIEILGYLLIPNEDEYNYSAGFAYFKEYWNNYLSEVNENYSHLASIFYKLLRHGLAHTFISKHGIQITKNTRRSLFLDLENKQLIMDCVVFYWDFEKSYLNQAKSELLNNMERTERKIRSLADSYSQDSEMIFNELETRINSGQSVLTDLILKPSATNLGSIASGASLSLQMPSRTTSTSVSGTGSLNTTTLPFENNDSENE